MRKAVVVLTAVIFAAVLFPRPAAAEITFNLGVKGGISSTNIAFEEGGPEGDFKSLMNPVFGAYFSLNLNRVFSLQPEVYFFKQGGKLEEEYEGSLYKIEVLLNYIHVPVLAKVHLVKEGTVRPVLFAGPAFSFLGKAVQKFYIDGSLEEEEDVKEFLKNSNISAVFGGGLEFYLGKLMLVLDVRYDLGLVDIDAKSETTKAKTKALTVMAGIGF